MPLGVPSWRAGTNLQTPKTPNPAAFLQSRRVTDTALLGVFNNGLTRPYFSEKFQLKLS